MLSPTALAIILLSGAIIVLALWLIMLERRITRLLRGKNALSLEENIADGARAITRLEEFRTATEETLRAHDARIRKKLSGPKTLRFNPFAGTGTGSNQSFASAFLDDDGDGVVLSTLYSRDKVSVYAKPIERKHSEYELSEEEQRVLE